MIRKFLFATMFLACFACAPNHTPPKDMPLGPVVGVPVGAVDYCHRHPEVENCK